MADLAALISDATRSGRIAAITVWPAGAGWQVNAKNKAGGWNCITCTDVVDGLQQALSGPFSTPSVPAKTAPAAKGGGVFD